MAPRTAEKLLSAQRERRYLRQDAADEVCRRLILTRVGALTHPKSAVALDKFRALSTINK